MDTLNPILKRADILASWKMLAELPKNSVQMHTVYLSMLHTSESEVQISNFCAQPILLF